MLAKVFSVATVGLESVLVTVEIDIASQGLPNFTIVGLPNKSVEESRERVRAAIKNSGGEFPARRITVNLAPADLPKEGPQYDLPIAVGILIASGQLPPQLEKSLFIGELSLDGLLRHTNGVLPAALFAQTQKYTDVFVPDVDANEAAVVSDICVYPVASLIQLFRHISKTEEIVPKPHRPFSQIKSEAIYEFDFADIRGQEQAKRALEIAAAGGHNVFLKGPPGAGKTMLSRSFPGILPQLSEKEAYEVTKIYSITGNIPAGESVIKHRPFRCPHHTTSQIGLIGGGTKPVPGEISLAHRGVLFLDEFPEFSRTVLEALRQPMEDGRVTISRAAGTVTFPARFLLIAAANPCPCGNFGDPTKRCTCHAGMITRYQKRISGPILDRIDLHLEVPAVATGKLVSDQTPQSENSKTVRARVEQAREAQRGRFTEKHIFSNAEMSTQLIKEFCPLDTQTVSLLQQAVSKLKLSARSYYKMIKVGRTIADLAGAKNIESAHIAEALQYRPRMEN